MQNIEVPAENEGDGAAQVEEVPVALDGTLTSNVAPVVNEEMTESSNPIRTSPTNVQQVRRSLEDKMKGTLFHTYIYIYTHLKMKKQILVYYLRHVTN